MYSRQEHLSDGTLTSLDLAIGYIKRGDISVLLDGIVTSNWEWVPGNNSIRFPAPIPAGVLVTINRATQRDKVINVFDKGASFTNRAMDTDFQQMLYLAQEYTEGAGISDFYSDLDMHGFRVRNVADAVLPSDVVNLRQLEAKTAGVQEAAESARQAAADASAAAVRADSLRYDLRQPGGSDLISYGSESLSEFLKRSRTLHSFLSPEQRVASKSGVKIDMTVSIQQAINQCVGGTLVIDSGLYGVSFGQAQFGMALDIPSNIRIEFEPGAILEAMPHNATIYQFMRVWDRVNVHIVRPTLNGRRDLNAATTGEFGMGVDIRGCNHVVVDDAKTDNMWGDGIYLGHSAGMGAPKNIFISRPAADNCRRQGMSIVSGVNVHVVDPEWTNINGAMPQAGLDIEPDNNDCELRGVYITNARTVNCVTGIQIQLVSMAGPKAKVVDIQIANHTDADSAVSFTVSGVNTRSGVYSVTGRIDCRGALWQANKQAAFLMSEYDARGPVVTIERPVVIDPNRSGQTSPFYGSAFVVFRDTPSAYTYPMGNLRIVEPTVVLRSGAIPRVFSFTDQATGVAGITDCHFLDPVRLLGMADVRGNFRGAGTISDKYNVWGYALGGSGALDFNYAAVIVTPNASVSLTLPSATSSTAGSPDVMIRNGGDNSVIVATATGGNFVGSAVGQRLQSPVSSRGSYVRLRPLGNNQWLIMERFGVWNII